MQIGEHYVGCLAYVPQDCQGHKEQGLRNSPTKGGRGDMTTTCNVIPWIGPGLGREH